MAESKITFPLKEIPIGKSDWNVLRSTNQLIVDKTALLGNLVSKNFNVFISRPRRFGKTTLINMLEELFTNGDKNFEGTAIYGNWPITERYRVVKLSFNTVTVSDPSNLEAAICARLLTSLNQAGIPEAANLMDLTTFNKLFINLPSILKNEGLLVYLIDEWDFPLSSNLDNPQAFSKVQEILGVFYGWLREQNTRFTLVTGIMRYKETNFFTGRDIFDISLEPDYATLLGYTQEEIETSFAGYIDLAIERLRVSRNKFLIDLKNYYDGFCFDYNASVKLYCPWSINKFFKQITPSSKDLYYQNFWADTNGDPAALRAFMNRAQPNYSMIAKISDHSVSLTNSKLTSPQYFSDVEFYSLLALNGYLTIKELEKPIAINPQDRSFLCGFPNQEVALYFSKTFLEYATDNKIVKESTKSGLTQAIEDGDIASACIYINEYLRDLLFDVMASANEIQYRNLIASAISFSSFQVREETGNNKGRSDIEVEVAVSDSDNNLVYVIELKLMSEDQDQDSHKAKYKLLDEAQQQIIKNGYGVNRFTHGKHVIGVALVISSEHRQIVAWRKFDRANLQDGEVAPLNLFNKPEYQTKP